MKTKEIIIISTLIGMIMMINVVNYLRSQRLRQSTVVIAEEMSIKIPVNSAGVERLEDLPGIGPRLADRIVQYRNDHGNFKTLGDLKKVKGIGDKMLEQISPFIKLQ